VEHLIIDYSGHDGRLLFLPYIEGMCQRLANLRTSLINTLPTLPSYLHAIANHGKHQLAHLYLDLGDTELGILPWVNMFQALETLSLDVMDIAATDLRQLQPIYCPSIIQFNLRILTSLPKEDGHLLPEYISRCRINMQCHVYFSSEAYDPRVSNYLSRFLAAHNCQRIKLSMHATEH
jgi:hypothetical protein